jgi:hypothetical protein
MTPGLTLATLSGTDPDQLRRYLRRSAELRVRLLAAFRRSSFARELDRLFRAFQPPRGQTSFRRGFVPRRRLPGRRGRVRGPARPATTLGEERGDRAA